MTHGPAPVVVVNDASCLIDLRKAQLLHLLVQLPYRLVIPLPVRESELIRFTPQEWALLDAGIEVFDLPPARVTEAFAVKAAHPKLSANDCFCLVTTRCHDDAVLLTGDGLLRGVANADGRRVHGVLEQIIDAAKKPRPLEAATVRFRPQARIIEGQLSRRIDCVVRATTRRAVELIDVAARLVGHETASLPCPVGKDHDVLGHDQLPPQKCRMVAWLYITVYGFDQPPSTLVPTANSARSSNPPRAVKMRP